jgi:hypothetical protein
MIAFPGCDTFIYLFSYRERLPDPEGVDAKWLRTLAARLRSWAVATTGTGGRVVQPHFALRTQLWLAASGAHQMMAAVTCIPLAVCAGPHRYRVWGTRTRSTGIVTSETGAKLATRTPTSQIFNSR